VNCYLDSSVVLRVLFGETNPLPEWRKIRRAFSSRLLRIECLRTIERLRLQNRLSNEETARRLSGLQNILSHVGILSLTLRIQERAEQSFPTPLGTLDALHLATALAWRDTREKEFFFATHDGELALAAEAQGLMVIGVKE
jgi:predicted nucleic acid-binding protein